MPDFALIADSLPRYLDGLRVTLTLMLISVASGFLLSVPLAVARVSAQRWLSAPVWFFTYVLRGTPLLVQLFMVYFGFAQFEALRESWLWPWFKNAWFCAWFAFTLNTTAYTTEIFAGAIRATPLGEIEAARSLGIEGYALYRRILLPAALRRALPQYSNEVVGMMHATAIASTVSLVDLTRVARDIYAEYLLPAEAFGTAAAFYFLLTFGLVGLFKLAERRFLKHLRAAEPGVLEKLPDAH
jgi:arginine/ornithine transport system permease protein